MGRMSRLETERTRSGDAARELHDPIGDGSERLNDEPAARRICEREAVEQ